MSVKPFRQGQAPELYNAALLDIDYLLAELDRLKGDLQFAQQEIQRLLRERANG